MHCGHCVITLQYKNIPIFILLNYMKIYLWIQFSIQEDDISINSNLIQTLIFFIVYYDYNVSWIEINQFNFHHTVQFSNKFNEKQNQ